MTDVWKRVLEIDQVGVHDNFFDVGGHSLLLPVLLSEIRKEFERDVAMVTLLEKPTISASAALFGEADAEGDLAVERGRERASRVREMTRRQAGSPRAARWGASGEPSRARSLMNPSPMNASDLRAAVRARRGDRRPRRTVSGRR